MLRVREHGAQYERWFRGLVLRVRGVRLTFGYDRYVMENGRPSRWREVTCSVSWTGRPLAPRGFPAKTPPDGGRVDA